jgi:hypothetical protein
MRLRFGIVVPEQTDDIRRALQVKEAAPKRVTESQPVASKRVLLKKYKLPSGYWRYVYGDASMKPKQESEDSATGSAAWLRRANPEVLAKFVKKNAKHRAVIEAEFRKQGLSLAAALAGKSQPGPTSRALYHTFRGEPMARPQERGYLGMSPEWKALSWMVANQAQTTVRVTGGKHKGLRGLVRAVNPAETSVADPKTGTRLTEGTLEVSLARKGKKNLRAWIPYSMVEVVAHKEAS